jgi:hypothetical protein
MNNYFRDPTVKSTKPAIIIATLFFFIAIPFAGCMDAMHSAYVSAYPTFEETEDAWYNVESDKGRIVVYFPKLPSLEKMGYGKFGFSYFNINDGKTLVLEDQTFWYFDLPEGTYQFKFWVGGIFGSKATIPVTMEGGKIKFLRVATTEFDDFPPKLIEEMQAREELKLNVHHKLKDPVPYNAKHKI